MDPVELVGAGTSPGKGCSEVGEKDTLIDPRLNNRLDQFARRGENQVPEGAFKTLR